MSWVHILLITTQELKLAQTVSDTCRNKQGHIMAREPLHLLGSNRPPHDSRKWYMMRSCCLVRCASTTTTSPVTSTKRVASSWCANDRFLRAEHHSTGRVASADALWYDLTAPGAWHAARGSTPTCRYWLASGCLPAVPALTRTLPSQRSVACVCVYLLRVGAVLFY